MWPWKASFQKIEEKLDKLDQKLERADSRLDSVDRTLAVQAEQLKEHMRRSAANEAAVEIIKEELKPVFAHVSVVSLVGKTLLVLITSGAVLKLVQVLINL